MVNQYNHSCYCAYCELQIQENPTCRESTSTDINMESLLKIIKMNEGTRYKYYCKDDVLKRPSSMPDVGHIPNHKNWKSKINDSFKSLIDDSLSSFAIKINEINCGSWEQKIEFLSAISQEIEANYPFKMINNLMISFVDEKVAKVVLCCVEEEIKEIDKNKQRNYDELKKIIAKKLEENMLKEDNKLELINAIQSKILKSHEERNIEEILTFHFDLKKIPFATFMELYRNHISENYDLIVSKSIDILEDLVLDEKYCMSFAFDSIFGEMIIGNESKKLRNTIYISEHYFKILLNDLETEGRINFSSTEDDTRYTHGYSNVLEYKDCFAKFITKSQIELEDRINNHLKKNNIIVIENNVITTCNESFIKRISYCATKHLEKELRLYLRQIRNRCRYISGNTLNHDI